MYDLEKRTFEFAKDEGYILEERYKVVYALGDEVGAMLWRTIENKKLKSA